MESDGGASVGDKAKGKRPMLEPNTEARKKKKRTMIHACLRPWIRKEIFCFFSPTELSSWVGKLILVS